MNWNTIPRGITIVLSIAGALFLAFLGIALLLSYTTSTPTPATPIPTLTPTPIPTYPIYLKTLTPTLPPNLPQEAQNSWQGAQNDYQWRLALNNEQQGRIDTLYAVKAGVSMNQQENKG